MDEHLLKHMMPTVLKTNSRVDRHVAAAVSVAALHTA